MQHKLRPETNQKSKVKRVLRIKSSENMEQLHHPMSTTTTTTSAAVGQYKVNCRSAPYTPIITIRQLNIQACTTLEYRIQHKPPNNRAREVLRNELTGVKLGEPITSY